MTKTTAVKSFAKTTVQRVYEVARESLRLHPKDDEAAADAMLAALGMNAELDFLAGEVLRKAARYYLAEARGGGRSEHDTQEIGAPATSSAGVDDKDQHPNDSQEAFVPSAPAARPRQPAHHAAASKMLAKRLLNDFKVTLRQGSRVSYGSVRVASLPRMFKQYGKRIWVSEREKEVVRQTIEFTKRQARLPKDALVSDVIDDKALDTFIKKAMVIADAKAAITYSPEQSDD